MSLPRSKMIGSAPAWASINPASIPAGPKPTTIGRNFDFLLFTGMLYTYGFTNDTLFDLHLPAIWFSSSETVTSTLYVKCTSSLCLASTLFLNMVRLVMYFSFTFNIFAAFFFSKSSPSSSESLISFILIILALYPRGNTVCGINSAV